MTTELEAHESRVACVLEQMCALEWKRADARHWREMWRLTPEEMQRVVADARKRASDLVSDQHAIMVKVVTMLEHTLDAAYLDDDRKTVIEACKTLARITGAEAPRRVDVSMPLSELSDAEVERRYRAAAERAQRTLNGGQSAGAVPPRLTGRDG